MISQITSVWGAPAPHQSTNLQTRVKLCPIEGEGEKKKKKNTITTAFRGGQTSATLFMRLKTSARKNQSKERLPHRKGAV